MIGKQIKGTSFWGVLNYLHDKEGSELIGGNMSGQEPRSLSAEFRLSRELNLRVKRAVYHASLSLPKSESLDDGAWMAIAQDYLKGMRFEGCQFVVYRHTDQDHDHVHIVASRIRLTNGKTVSDSWDYRRSEGVIRQLEQDYQLQAVLPSWEQEQCAPMTGERRFLEQTGKASVREQLQVILNNVAQEGLTMPQMIERSLSQGISVRVVQTRKGIRGISYGMDGVAFSGTKLGRAFTFPGLQKYRGVNYDPVRDDEMVRSLIDRGIQQAELVQSQLPERSPSIADGEAFVLTPSKKERYQQMWQRYSQEVEAKDLKQLDFLVCRRALADGQSPKAIGLMLAAGSPRVEKIRQERGRESAKGYVSWVAKEVCQRGKQGTRKRRMQPEIDQ
jgi:Relaxase/Mobilisation nuclease domain